MSYKNIHQRLAELMSRAHELWKKTNNYANYPGTSREDIYMYLYYRRAQMLEAAVVHLSYQVTFAKLLVRHEHLDYLERLIEEVEDEVGLALGSNNNE